jgi:NADH:ubiquinone oxidoreductase subunit 2 (subunit N)
MRFSGRKRGKKLDTLESASVAKYVLYGMNFNHNRRKSAPKYKKRSDLSIASMSG